ncbi:MAG: MarR family winged helix-turn-helix transcriptional regulator [Chloroflexota bacterium]
MANPNKSSSRTRPAVERALEAFETFESLLMAVHAPEFTAFDLTMAQAKLLYVVTATKDLSVSEIAARLGVTISTASGAVDHLVSVGLLDRVDDPANRRQVRVSVTPLGRETLERMRELNTRQLRALFDLVADTDLAVVERAIRILTDAIAAGEPATEPATSTRSES